VKDWSLAFCLPHGLVPNGMTTWALNTATHLARRGWPVQVLAHERHASYPSLDINEVARAYGIDIRLLPNIDDAVDWQSVQQEYARALPAVFFPTTVEQGFEHIAALSLHRPDDVRCIGWNHLNHEYEYAMWRHFLPLCDALISNTTDGFQRLIDGGKRTGIDVIQTQHLPCPLANDRKDEAAIDQSHKEGQLRIAYAGRFEDTAKRVGDLVAIAEELTRRETDFVLTLIGSGPLTSLLQKRADELNAQHRRTSIDIRSPLPPHEMGPFWQAQDVLLLASAYEGQSMQLMEAMRHGCVPVISRGAAAGVNLARAGETALLFDIGATNQAADYLQRLAQQPNERKRLAERARSAAMAAFAPAPTLDYLDELLTKVVQRPSHRWPVERPISMRSTTVSTADDEDAVRRFRNVAEAVARIGRLRVAIYGAGRHTRGLATALADCTLDIRCIIDDDTNLHGNCLWGWPIVGREAAPNCDIEAVILSSKMNEAYLLTHKRFFASHGIDVFALYTSQENSMDDIRTVDSSSQRPIDTSDQPQETASL